MIEQLIHRTSTLSDGSSGGLVEVGPRIRVSQERWRWAVLKGRLAE